MEDSKTKYKVDGMHCASCEILISNEVSELPGVKEVKADFRSGVVEISFKKTPPKVSAINKKIGQFGYKVAKDTNDTSIQNHIADLRYSLPLSFGVIILLILIEKASNGIFSQVTSQGVLSFLLLGVVASFSSCAALIGGLILSLSEKWNASPSEGLRANLLFQSGRIGGFFLLGGLLGAVGSILTVSIEVTALLVILASIVMITLGLQMIGVFKQINKIKLSLPFELGQSNSKLTLAGKIREAGPIFLGVTTFFLPCGFTFAAQTQALSSGSPVAGALGMGAFALGTLPVLTFIGLSARYFTLNNKFRNIFMQTAGFIVIALALYTFNNQLVLLGIPNLFDLI